MTETTEPTRTPPADAATGKPVLFAYDGSELAATAIEQTSPQLAAGRDALVVCVWQPSDVGFSPVDGCHFDAANASEVRAAAEATASATAFVPSLNFAVPPNWRPIRRNMLMSMRWGSTPRDTSTMRFPCLRPILANTRQIAIPCSLLSHSIVMLEMSAPLWNMHNSWPRLRRTTGRLPGWSKRLNEPPPATLPAGPWPMLWAPGA